MACAVTGHSVGRTKKTAVPASQAKAAQPRGMDHRPRWKSQRWKECLAVVTRK